MHLSRCNADSGSCACPYGLAGQYCQLILTDGHEEAFAAWRFTFVALYVLVVILLFCVLIEFWVRKVVVFPRFNREQTGLACAFLAALLELLYVSLDPFRLAAASANAVTAGLRVGSAIIANLSLAFTALGWAVVLLMWLEVRAVTHRAKSRQIAIRIFLCVVIITLAMAFLCAGLLVSPIYGTADIIFYVFLGVLAAAIGVAVMTSAWLTFFQLSRFKKNHEKRLVRLTIHMIIAGTCFFLAIVALLVVAALNGVNSTFAAFYGFRCWFAFVIQLFCILMIGVLLRYRKWKDEGSHYEKKTQTVVNMVGNSNNSNSNNSNVASSNNSNSDNSDISDLAIEFEKASVVL